METTKPNVKSSLGRQFLKACQRGDLKKIQCIFKELDNKDWTEYRHVTSGDTSLHIAAREGYIDVVRYLCEHSDNVQQKVNVVNFDMKGPLHEAAQFSHCEILNYLINQGADVNSIKRADWTPLMLACTKSGINATDCIQRLLESGAETMLRNKDGWTALFVACRTGDINAIRLLLQHSPESVEKRSNNGRTALHIAAFHGCHDIFDVLVQSKPNLLNSQDSSGSTPLHESVKSHDFDSTIRLLDLGADVHAIDNVKQNALHIAASTGNTKVAEYLLRNKLISVESEADFGVTPLIAARKNNTYEVVRILLDFNATR